MTIPPLYAACRANPRSEFVMLTRKGMVPMFVCRPENLTVVGVDLDSYRGVPGMLRLAREMREKYGITDHADLHDVLRTKLLRVAMLLRGVRVRHLRKMRLARRRLTRAKGKRLVQLRPMPDRYSDVFLSLGLRAGDFSAPVASGISDTPGTSLPEKISGDTWIAVAPFARHPGKTYPLHLMCKMVDRLAERERITVFLLGGGPEETEKLAEMADGHPNVVSVASMKLGLAGEMRLMDRCDLMVSMDSANMHLASLTGLRTVSIWGATHPFAGFLGIGQREEDTVQLPLECRPCSVFGNRPCRRGDYKCLNAIPIETVAEHIDRALADRLKPHPYGVTTNSETDEVIRK